MSDRNDPRSDPQAVERLDDVEMTEAQKRARKRRNVAIGAGLLLMVAIFYVATVTKLGPRVMDRPIIAIEN